MYLTYNSGFLFQDNLAVDTDYVWYIPYGETVLLRVDRNDGKTKCIVDLCHYSEKAFGFRYLVKTNDFLYVLPFFADRLIEINLKVYSVNSYKMPRDRRYPDGVINGFYSYVVCNNCMYMFGKYPTIVGFDLVSKRINSWDIPDKRLKTDAHNELVFDCGMTCGKKLLVHNYAGGELISFDLDETKCDVIMDYQNEKFFSVSSDRMIFFDDDKRELLEIMDDQNAHTICAVDELYPIEDARMVLKGEKSLYFFTRKNGKVFKYNLDDCFFSFLEDMPCLEESEWKKLRVPIQYWAASRDKNGHILTVYPYDRALIDIDEKTGMIKKTEILINRNELMKYLIKRGFAGTAYPIVESEVRQLDWLIETI